MSTTSGARRLAPGLAAATVLAVLLGGGWLVRSSSTGSPGAGPGDPPVLRLSDYQPPGNGGAPDDRFRLTVTLPDDRPDDAAVRWLTVPSRSQVDRLARALGVPGGDPSLTVQDGPGGLWQFRGSTLGGPVPTCPVPPTLAPSDKGLSSYPSCVVASPVPLADDAPDVAVTTRTRALAVAGPVLQAVGIDPSTAAAGADGPTVTVVADPTVAGRPTSGMATSVTVHGDEVSTAGGFLPGTRDGDAYPVISARQAWHRLQRSVLDQPLMACPATMPPNIYPLTCGGPVTVTGARFGLSLHQQGQRWVLVPSWLFDVRDAAMPVAVVAVDDAFLGSAPVPGGSGSGSGGGSASPGPESRFSSVALGADGSSLVVGFAGGVADCYDYRVVPEETANRVLLSLVETPTTDGPCMDLAQVYERRVRLDRPLETRQVIDAETGAVLLGPSR